MEPLGKFLRDTGWTVFYIPSARFNAGTVITPAGQDLKLDPGGNCFPKHKMPPGELAVLPDVEQGREFAAETGVALLKGLIGSAAGSVADAATAHVAFFDIRHIAVDMKSLSDSYVKDCDAFLSLIRDPVVIPELLAGNPNITFKKRR
jgi:hypothetical protein